MLVCIINKIITYLKVFYIILPFFTFCYNVFCYHFEFTSYSTIILERFKILNSIIEAKERRGKR